MTSVQSLTCLDDIIEATRLRAAIARLNQLRERPFRAPHDVDGRRARRAQGSLARGREGDGASAGRATHCHRTEGIPRLDVPGNRRFDRLPVEYGEDAVVPRTHSVAP